MIRGSDVPDPLGLDGEHAAGRDRVVVEKLIRSSVFSRSRRLAHRHDRARTGSIGKAFEFVGVLPDTGTEHLIKRVIGLAGDRVICCDEAGRLTVNGQALNEASYLFTEPDGAPIQPSTFKFDVVVTLVTSL